tara:strand:+ start:1896 stop:1997 length:102 start_codon:yes stop_codon:yes gene_type:complete
MADKKVEKKEKKEVKEEKKEEPVLKNAGSNPAA